MASNDFTKGEESQIKDLAREIFPEVQKSCGGFRFFEDNKKVEKLFQGFTKIDNLIERLDNHEDSHIRVETEITKLKKNRWFNKIYIVIGSAFGGFAAAWADKKLRGH